MKQIIREEIIKIQPKRTRPYPVRSYTDDEIEGFLKLDEKQSKELKKKGLL